MSLPNEIQQKVNGYKNYLVNVGKTVFKGELSDKLEELTQEELILTADKDIIQIGDTVNLTVTLYSDKCIYEQGYRSERFFEIYNGNTRIASGRPDSNQKTFSYQGTGAGKLNLYAKYININPTYECELQSETYGILDALLYDNATSFVSANWNNLGVTASYSDDGTNLKPSTDYRYQSSYAFGDGNVAIEFEVYVPSTVSANPLLYCRGQSSTLNATDVPRDTWNTYKIEFNGNNMKFYSNGTFLYELNPSSINNIFQFRVSNSELTFKDFRVYTI